MLMASLDSSDDCGREREQAFFCFDEKRCNGNTLTFFKMDTQSLVAVLNGCQAFHVLRRGWVPSPEHSGARMGQKGRENKGIL